MATPQTHPQHLYLRTKDLHEMPLFIYQQVLISIVLMELLCRGYINQKFEIQMHFYFVYNQAAPAFVQSDQNLCLYSNFINLYPDTYETHSFQQIYANFEHKPQLATQCDNTASIPPITPQIDPPVTLKTTASTRNKPRIDRNLNREIMNAKKNSESNIVNQFFSFFSNPYKSQKIVEKTLLKIGKLQTQMEKTVPFFYMLIRSINLHRGRRYVNAASLTSYFTKQQVQSNLVELKGRIQPQFPTTEDLCQIFRRCAQHFLAQVSVNAILTSKRISLVSKREHIRKTRRVLAFINQ